MILGFPPSRRRASGLLLALLLLVGALPLHGAHGVGHGEGGAHGLEIGKVGEEPNGSAHGADSGDPGHHHAGPHAGDAEAPASSGETDHAPDAPCPRGPCPSGAPACAATLGAPVLPALPMARILEAASGSMAERAPPATASEPPFRPPRGGSVLSGASPAG